MNKNAEIIFLLCSHLSAQDCKPYEPAQWTRLAQTLLEAKLQPSDLPALSDKELLELGIGQEEAERIRGLLERGGNLAFEMEKLENMGISVVTRADAAYPKRLKARLGKSCPPLFYYAGDLGLAERGSVGFVGSRSAGEEDRSFTRLLVSRMNGLGYGVVTGGAKGVDSFAQEASLENGSFSVAYLSDSMIRRVRTKDVISAVQGGRLLLLSAVSPEAGFSPGTAMMRNRFIYAHSLGTVVVRSDLKKGGTWTGAADCLKHKLCPVFCRDEPAYEGNRELIRLGAVPIDESWTGDLTAPPEEEYTQLSFLD